MEQQLYDACVIGAGPAGITAAIELADRGLHVLLVESGTEKYDLEIQRLSDATITSAGSHSVMAEAVRRGLGGTSAIWGGRCVPLDDMDFVPRDFVPGSGWPFKADELKPYYQRACDILGVGAAKFDAGNCAALTTRDRRLSSNFVATSSIRATELERWSGEPNTWSKYKDSIERHACITVASGLTCVGFRQSQLGGAVTEALVRPSQTGGSGLRNVRARVFVIAAGGVESTRLILNSLQDPQGLKLESPQFVGRYYMGHPSGKIADIELSGDSSQTLYGFETDGDTYVRRRITFYPDVLLNEKLLNIAFWLDNPPLSDWRHGSGVLSAAYLALTAPLIGHFLAPAAIRKRIAGETGTQRMRHLLNCLRSPLRTGLFCVRFVYQHYMAKPRLPGFFTYSSVNRYALHYHAEHAPNWHSTIALSNEADAHGLRRAKIALEWSSQDIASIRRAHEVLDNELQKHGIGRLVYRYPQEALDQSILEQAVDGFHQVGSLRMASDPSDGVTDVYGRLHGTANCFVASSAIFPTSGQANPTLAMIALIVRQAEHIAAQTDYWNPRHA